MKWRLTAAALAALLLFSLLAIDSRSDEIAGALVFSGEITAGASGSLYENPRISVYNKTLTEIVQTLDIDAMLKMEILGVQRAE